MTDHQRWDSVEPDNPCLIPVANRLARQGLKFTHTFSPMAHCCPARATFMSGLYPSRTGVWNNVDNAYAINRGPFKSVKMWSQDLKDSGYDLAGVKKERYFTGESLVPFIKDEKPKEWREEICTQCEGTEQMFTQRMVVTQQADPAYETVKKDLVERMWRFAYREQDRLGAVQYLMVNTAPWGPKAAFWSEKGKTMATAEPNREISR